MPDQKGEGQLRLIATLLAVGTVTYSGFQFAGPKIAHSRLHDTVVDECRLASNPRRSEETIRRSIWNAAVAAGLDAYLDMEDIHIQKISNRIRISIEYDRDIELPGFVYRWHLKIKENRMLY